MLAFGLAHASEPMQREVAAAFPRRETPPRKQMAVNTMVCVCIASSTEAPGA
jgi:hypothetical protein